ncbi:MAG: oligoendopeptidase F family protein, partial [Anaerolineales bacterium]|nr:oligoendopeptidase F family protein [Anaerolineales bacterium]
MPKTIPPRNKVSKKYTWNAESVFKSPKEWEAALQAVINDIPKVKSFEGKLGEGPETLLNGIKTIEALIAKAQTVFMYAQFTYAVDTTNQAAAAMVGKAQGMSGQVGAATSFLNPELLYIGREKLESWMNENEELAVYRHSFDDLFRQQAHVRSAEVEEILGMTADPFSGPSTSSSMLVNADFKFAPAKDSKGKKIPVTQSNYYSTLLEHSDRKVRQSAFESYHDKHLEFKNTLAANLSTSISANVFNMRARRFDSTLSASLFNNNIPDEVFHNLINTFKKKLPVWHRYFEIKRKALKLKDIQYFDMWAPIAKKKVSIPFEKAVDYISDSLKPLGDEYVSALRDGCLKQRWVDSTPNLGKMNGAFSYGSTETHPFIMMSYTDEVGSMSTLAHELGHSMHSYLTWKN